MPGMRYQPQGLVRIDQTNPITLSLLSARVAGQQNSFGAGPKGRYMTSPGTNGGYVNPDIVQCTGAGVGTMTGLNAFTFVSLIRRNNSGSSGSQTSIRYRTSNVNGVAMALGTGSFNSNTVITFWGPTNTTTWTAPVAPAGGEVMFVAGVWDKINNVQYLYVNGALVASGTAGTNAIPTTNGPYAMYECDASGSNTNLGVLPYANLIYGRALSSSEIFSLYNNIWQVFESTLEYNVDFDYVAAAPTIISTVGASFGSSNPSATAQAIFNVFGSSQGVASGFGPTIGLFYTVGMSNNNAGGTASGVSVYLAGGSTSCSSTVSGNTYSVWSVQAISSGSAENSVEGVSLFKVDGGSVGLSTASGTGETLNLSGGSSSGSATGISASTAVANSFYNAIANSVGNAAVSGEGVILACASGSSTGLSGVEALSVAIYGADGVSISSSQIQAEASYIASVLASSEGKSTVSGTTSGGLHYTAVGDKFAITIVFAHYSVNFQTDKYRITFN